MYIDVITGKDVLSWKVCVFSFVVFNNKICLNYAYIRVRYCFSVK
jgi:hypothetical protein